MKAAPNATLLPLNHVPEFTKKVFPFLAAVKSLILKLFLIKTIYTTYSLIIRIKDRNSTKKLFNSTDE